MLTEAELHRAARTVPLAASHDATRLMAVVRAKTPHRALHRLRRRLDPLLPIDVISTHYPDPQNHTLLNIAFPPAVHDSIRRAATARGQAPHTFVEQTLSQAVARQTRNEADYLDLTLHALLTRTSTAQLLAALGRALTTGAHSC
ncbi:hypothetical protein [Streptomyces sp. SM10]|uniref:hypothetical protein n=1 Tax=Streptomyces sp. SM10 TaxID=565556 RepID=UPI0027E5B5AF|nr:hypothetical protein [Streptomyces sp. SM10]